ncbi:LysR family transcriptional regulator [Yersinia intermedia]|uniref:LysR family transcriptional regulator n=1 Tax=Yersinia intermedia TaxID=631 RepID=UPI0005DD9337|nr:LysR family transcriptional regulator [Yersinia intermedia]MCB5298835.1 LysR family transcriptional regulator [Yersinia intermedia]MDA5482671.1 LysR family transcriptional regulator [Yersinia intermedia]CNI08425.1 LysR family transcriptional regulator [Yersinia intermedia]CNJ88745.1 LysR family transcriptional regulator [Yersinia intermedia]
MSLPLDIHRLLPAFLTAAQSENFSTAARQLGITPAAVSKNIRVLEEKLALRLFQRNTHSVVLTDEGKTLLARVAPLWQALSNTLDTVRNNDEQQPSGTVRVSVIPGFGRQLLMPLIPKFMARYPQIDLDLSLEARVVNLVGEGFDVGIGTRIDPDSRLIARQFYPMQMLLAASPAYLARNGSPTSPQDLYQHQCLIHRNPSNGRRVKWQLQQNNEVQSLELSGRLISSQPDMLLHAALADMGITYVAQWHAASHFADGSLMPVLASYWPTPTPVWLYYASADLPPRVRVWVDFLLKHFGPHHALSAQ